MFDFFELMEDKEIAAGSMVSVPDGEMGPNAYGIYARIPPSSTRSISHPRPTFAGVVKPARASALSRAPALCRLASGGTQTGKPNGEQRLAHDTGS